jgi:hypothetical protein
MADNDLKKKIWALHIGGENLAKMLQPKIELVEGLDGTKVAVGGVGKKVIADMLIKIHAKNQDPVFEELIPMLPTMSAISDWLQTIPKFEVTDEEFEHLAKLGHIF